MSVFVCVCILFFVVVFTHILLQKLGLPMSLAVLGRHHIILQIRGLHYPIFFYDMGLRLIVC